MSTFNVTPEHAPLTPDQQALVTQYLPLAATLASRRLRSQVRNAAWHDAYQDMALALMEAASRWRPEGGKTFRSYAWSLMVWRGARLSCRFQTNASVEMLERGATDGGEALPSFTARAADPAPSIEARLAHASGVEQKRARLLPRLTPSDRAAVDTLLTGESITARAAARITRLVKGEQGAAPGGLKARRTALRASSYFQAWAARQTPEQREARLARVRAQTKARYQLRRAPAAKTAVVA
jgi:hypothetical protein